MTKSLSLHVPCNTFFVLTNSSSFQLPSFNVSEETLPSWLQTFVFSANQIGKKILTRNSTLRNLFSSALLYCSVKLAHVLSAQKKVSFFGDMLFQSKNSQITNLRDKYRFQRSQILVFPKFGLFIYFQGKIFLRVKIFKGDYKSNFDQKFSQVEKLNQKCWAKYQRYLKRFKCYVTKIGGWNGKPLHPPVFSLKLHDYWTSQKFVSKLPKILLLSLELGWSSLIYSDLR